MNKLRSLAAPGDPRQKPGAAGALIAYAALSGTPVNRDRQRQAARQLLDWLCALWPGAAGARLATHPGGQPKLEIAAGRPALPCSLSHTKGLVAVAIGRAAIGVDVETESRPFRQPALLQRIASAEERSAILALPAGEQAQATLRLWTLKEAWAKADGRGIAAGLARTRFEGRDQHLRAWRDGLALSDWQFGSVRLDSGHRLSWALAAPAPAVELLDAGDALHRQDCPAMR